MKRHTVSIGSTLLRNMMAIAATSLGLWCLVWLHDEYAAGGIVNGHGGAVEIDSVTGEWPRVMVSFPAPAPAPESLAGQTSNENRTS